MARPLRYLVAAVLFLTGAFLLTRVTGSNPILAYFISALFFGMAIAAFSWARRDD